jgi:hypothetical protein
MVIGYLHFPIIRLPKSMRVESYNLVAIKIATIVNEGHNGFLTEEEEIISSGSPAFVISFVFEKSSLPLLLLVVR